MKKALLTLFLTAGFFSTIIAQNACSKYYPMEEGATLAYTSFNKKGKVDGKVNYVVTEVSNSASQTKATMQIKYEDAKGKNTFDTSYNINCTGNGIKIDFKSLMPAQLMDQYKSMNVELDMQGTDIELPNELSVGQTLADANISMQMKMTGITMNVNVTTTDRKVEKQETITTAAGSFDCYVISETIQSKSMGANMKFLIKTWFAEGVGMIKNETYKKNGTLEGRVELTQYSK